MTYMLKGLAMGRIVLALEVPQIYIAPLLTGWI